MNTNADFVAQLEKNLLSGIELLGDVYSCQKRMYQAVVARDWVRVQSESDNMKVFTAAYAEIERKREALLASYARALPASCPNPGFYTITCTLEPDARERVNSLYRETKRLMVLSRTENDVLNSYIVNAKALVSGILETVVPARKNKIYTRKGSIAPAAAESLVVNRSF